MRSEMVRAASRRGCVCPMLSRPSSRQIFGSCVVLPDPVAPATMTTWLSRMASAISSRIRLTGSSGGYAMLNSMLVSVYPRAVEHPGGGRRWLSS